MSPVLRWVLMTLVCLVLGAAILVLCIFLKDSASNAIKLQAGGIANSETVQPEPLALSTLSIQSSLPTLTYSAPALIQELPYSGYQGVNFLQSAALALSADGNTVAIGAYWASCVYIRSKSASGSWVQEAALVRNDPPDGWSGPESPPSSWFGYSTSLSADGNTCACGAYGHSKVWIFTRTNGEWTSEVELSRPLGSGYGISTAISYDGNTVAIGETNMQGSGADRVHILARTNATWNEQTVLTPLDKIGPCNFGQSIGLSGNGCTIVIGGPLDNNNVGAVWVSQLNNDTWTVPVKLSVNVSPSMNQGRRVAISGDGSTIAFTEINHDLNTYDLNFTKKWMATGRTYVYMNTGKNEWRLNNNVTPDTASAGASVCLNHNGERLYIGDTFAGCVYLLSKSKHKYYELTSKIEFQNPTEYTTFGYTVAVDMWGDTLAVGAPYEPSVAGGGNGLVGMTSIYTRSSGF